MPHGPMSLALSPVVGRYFRPDGTLAVVVRGGAGPEDAPPAGPPPVDPPSVEPPAGPPTDPPDPADPPVDDDEPLGPAGKRALDAERAAHKEARRKLKEAEDALEAARVSQLDDHERALVEARQAGEAEATTRLQSKLFSVETRAAAVTKLSDPTLLSDPDVALKLLGLDQIPVTPDGDIDSEAISQAIDTLVEGRPFLGLSGATPKPPPGSADGGPQGGTHEPDDLDTQIAKATQAGDARAVIALNNQKLAALAAS